MTICPKCGKENTSLFSDTTLKTHGFHCEDCHCDFGVDDDKKLKNYKSLFVEFYYQKIDKDNTVHEVLIKKASESTWTLDLTIIKDKVKSVSNTIDFSAYLDSFKHLLFETLFVLDWDDHKKGIVLENNNESYKLDIKFKLGLLPPIKKDGVNDFPPYEIALEKILLSLFEGM